jgi:light-regulated signal transduction histidine kinase (bacteriophytochrome)
VAVMTALAASIGVRVRSRRIEALNRSLHEIRRPLQVLALGVPDSRRSVIADRIASEPVRQAISALALLDHQINGTGLRPSKGSRSELVAARLMADACVRRWLPFARLAGSRLRLVWTGPDVLIRGDATALAAALENLITNAIEHGGPEIEVSGLAIGRKVRLVVTDTGDSRPGNARLDSVAPSMAGLSGMASHGHGLEVVRETVAAHGGRLDTEFGPNRSEAVIVLPVSQTRRSTGAGVKVNW